METLSGEWRDVCLDSMLESYLAFLLDQVLERQSDLLMDSLLGAMMDLMLDFETEILLASMKVIVWDFVKEVWKNKIVFPSGRNSISILWLLYNSSHQ